ncbi:DUF3108 domain-containing protein [Chromobacterium subtsugae]|uniref:DUF3108 domain-containing protein n=1 Tax=Chromobacterium subtsugae TaxID=251747 RepID=UPI000640D7DD|nr:DUF3108 domain-containing protein [Chromobacterium subtsugae]
MSRRRLLLIALFLSLALHFALLGSGMLPAISLPPAEDTKLEKIDIKMQAMGLEEAARPAPPAGAGVNLAPAGGAAKPAPKPKPKPKPQRKAAASQAADEPKAAASAPAAETAAGQGERAASAPHAETAPAPSASAPHAETRHAAAQTASEDAAKPQDPAGFLHPPQPLRKFPAAAKLSYQLYWNGVYAGTGELNWQQGHGRYLLETVATPAFAYRMFTRGYRYRVEGGIDAGGLRPDSMLSFEGDKAKEEARFDYAAGQLRYGMGAGQQVALRAGAQDIYSLAFQLGLKGGHLGDKALQITTAKKVYDYPMAPTGAFDYDTNAGKMRVAVFQAKGGGDTTEFWLATDFANLPVRITRIDDKKRIELRAVRIEVNGALQWELPPQPTIRNKNAH